MTADTEIWTAGKCTCITTIYFRLWDASPATCPDMVVHQVDLAEMLINVLKFVLK
jgi:hypothetical protein